MLHVHRAERSDGLVVALADVLATPLDDPLATEVVAVHSRGIERWISQELSTRLGTGTLGGDGVCANLDFPFPGKLIREAVARGSGIDPEADPWLPERLTWPLLELVDTQPTAPMLGPLALHVGGTPAQGTDGLARRLGAVRHVADLFDRYAVHRPEMILAWLDGQDVGAAGGALLARHRWQPQLWRAVRELVDVEGFAERRGSALARLREDPDLLDLPPRLALFGLTAMPASYLAVLEAIAVHREVHLLLLHPSADLWDRISGQLDGTAGQRLFLRNTDPTAGAPRNPLLRTWGRDARELQLVTPLPADPAQRHAHHVPTGPPRTLLQRVQADVRADDVPAHTTDGRATASPVLDPADWSIQVHACHGRLRQVEVVRDAVLHLLAQDPTLEPRDVIVMCPDIEVFAPLVTAVFGADAVHDESVSPVPDVPPALRVRLADRSLRRTNPVLEVVSLVLDLVDARLTASSIIDVLGRDPVRRRFRFDDDDLDTLETWIGELNIRWGLDATHRTQHGLPALDANTWRAGLRRLQLGIAMADEDLRTVGDVVPFDHVEGGASDLAGRLVEFIERLDQVLGTMRAPMTVDGWREAIGGAADALTLTDPDTAWQRVQLHAVLKELCDEAIVSGQPSRVAVTLAEVRALLTHRLAGRPSTTSHRTGDLTICTLVPMRSVPHRVVCLLGLDDGAFPRQVVPDSDDLLLDAPRVGDRDPRSEDRQLLLDALLAATDTLVVTYAGRDVRTNEPRPPAVPVDELLDVIDRTVVAPTDADGTAPRPRDLVTTHHPLAAHDPRNFEPGTVGRLDGPDGERTPWGFLPGLLEAARSRRAPSQPPRPFLSDPLALPDQDVIELDDLLEFLRHPVKAFVTQQLDVRLPSSEDERSDAIPSSLKGLDAWHVGDAVVQAWLRGDDRDRAEHVACARGVAPPTELATQDLQDVRATVDLIVDLCGHVGVEPTGRRVARDVEVELPDGRVLSGTVPDVHGARLDQVSYSRVAPKHRLATWARFLALTATEPAAPWEAVTVGRHSYRKGKAQGFRLPRLADDPARARDRAAAELGRLVDLYDRGRRAPIPLYCATSGKIADNLHGDRSPDFYVDKEWETDDYAGFEREDRDPYHLLVLGGAVPTQRLFDEACADDDERSWLPDRPRVVAYAWRLWEPVLHHERRRER